MGGPHSPTKALTLLSLLRLKWVNLGLVTCVLTLNYQGETKPSQPHIDTKWVKMSRTTPSKRPYIFVSTTCAQPSKSLGMLPLGTHLCILADTCALPCSSLAYTRHAQRVHAIDPHTPL